MGMCGLRGRGLGAAGSETKGSRKRRAWARRFEGLGREEPKGGGRLT